MKLTIFFILFSYICSFGYAQDQKSDRSKYNINGKVESVFSIKFKASVDSSGRIVKGEFNPIHLEGIYEVNLVSTSFISTPENSLFSFDKNGTIKSILYFYRNPYQLLYAEIRTSNTAQGQNEIIYGNGLKYNIQVTKINGNPIKRRVITERNDTIVSNYIYLKNHIIKDELYVNSSLESIITYNYNSRNHIIDKYVLSTYNKDTLQTNSYAYNKNGDVENETEKIRSFITHRKYDYKYDSNSNWITRYEYEENKLISLTEREIKYY